MANRIYVFTQRPASVRSEYNIELNKDNGALATRNLPGFKEYFDTLWKELDHEQTKIALNEYSQAFIIFGIHKAKKAAYKHIALRFIHYIYRVVGGIGAVQYY